MSCLENNTRIEKNQFIENMMMLYDLVFYQSGLSSSFNIVVDFNIKALIFYQKVRFNKRYTGTGYLCDGNLVFYIYKHIRFS